MLPIMTKPTGPENILDRLRRTRSFAFSVEIWGRLWPLLLPSLLVFALFLTVAWFGLFRIMPDWTRIASTSAFALLAIISLWQLRLFKPPTSEDVNRRIERVNRLRHTPILAQSDRLAGVRDPFAEALWREHKRRMSANLGNLTAGLPETGVPSCDPLAIRAIVALLFVTSFAWSFGSGGGAISDPFRSHDLKIAIPPRIDAWVTPPAYTGKAPIFMTARVNVGQDTYKVPAGSVVTLRATGASDVLALGFTGENGASEPLAPDDEVDPKRPGAPQKFTAELQQDGSLELISGEVTLQRWTFVVIPDLPPSISFSGEPKRALNGTLEMEYLIKDDYGAASARTLFRRADGQDENAHPLYDAPEFQLRLPRRGAKTSKSRTSRDMTEHPWAGTEVIAQLSVADAAGQEASSDEKRFVLPERPFSNPLARVAIEQRRILALDAGKKRRVLDLMEAVTLRPEDTFENMSHFLVLSSARSRLKIAQTDDRLREVVDYLWEIALGIEDGDLSAAERRLRQAQEALRQALENGASDEEIERLIAELREAMNEFLREFAEHAMQDPNFSQQMMQPNRELRQSDLERLLDQIEQSAKSGARDQAQELLSRLRDMMNNLQAGHRNNRQNDQDQSQMRERMNRLGEIMRGQQELMNETFRMDQMQRDQRGDGQQGNGRNGRQPDEFGQGGNEPGQNGQGGMTSGELAEILRRLQESQGQLEGRLGEFMQGLRGLGIEPDENFGEASREMGDAGDALGEGDGLEALENQSNAMEALRRGAEDMMNQMRQAMQGDSAGSQLGSRNRGDRDPLGRPRATTGPDFGESVRIPDEIDVQRAREILEAIRRRLGDVLSPDLERRYLERLLELR